MAVRDVLDPRVVDLHMEVKTKDEAIRHLSQKLWEAGYIGDEEEFINDIYLRESEGITGIGGHVAIPHGKSDSVTNVGIAIGKSCYDIPWESIDEEPVNIIFLFAVPFNHEYAKNHMRLLAELAGKLGNDSAITKLQHVKTFDELIEVFE